jgi:poly(A) polymerase
MNEIKRAGVITEQIFAGKASWKDLFVKQTFFTKDYKYYLSIISASTTKEEQKKWCGRVESRVRHLVSSAEEHDSIHIAHPFNKGFRRVHKCKTEEDVQKVKAGSLEYLFKEVPTETTDLAHDSVVGGVVKEKTLTEDKKLEEDERCTMVYTDTFYIGLELEAGK